MSLIFLIKPHTGNWNTIAFAVKYVQAKASYRSNP